MWDFKTAWIDDHESGGLAGSIKDARAALVVLRLKTMERQIKSRTKKRIDK